MKSLLILSLAAVFASSWGCSSANQEKTKEEMRKTGAELKRDGQELSKNIDHAVKPGTQDASQKLSEGTAKLEAAGSSASMKLSKASLIAQVKANMASDAGLSTITGIDVDADGSVVTLRGHVSSQAQKDAADHAAAKIDGVTRVINQISVTP